MKDKNIKFWSYVALALFIPGLIMIKLGGGFGSGAGSILTDSLSDSDWVKGSATAKVVIIEYSDFQCPSCAQYSKVLEEIMAEFGEHVALAYRHYPLETIHENSTPAAWAAEAAGIQGKFWEMHNNLFTYQNSWNKQEKPEEMFTKFAKDLNLDLKKFTEDYNSRLVHKKVELSLESAKENHLTYTPTIFINGQQINNPSTYEGFRTFVRETITSSL